jgi:hypothetical protein
MDDTYELEFLLGILTVVLVVLTVALVVLGYRTEKRMDRLIDVFLVETGANVERTIEVSTLGITREIEEVMDDLYAITIDAHVEAGVVDDQLVVSYRLSWESTVYLVLEKSVGDKKILPAQIYAPLAE